MKLLLTVVFTFYCRPASEDEPEAAASGGGLADTMDFIEMLDENSEETAPAYTGCFDYSVF